MAEHLALVTGASSGIGLSLAKELASRGYDLLICSAGERLSTATENLAGSGVEVTEVQADLATREGVDSLWKAVEATGRPLDIACINAGVGVGGNFWDTDLDQELKHGGAQLHRHNSSRQACSKSHEASRRRKNLIYSFHCR